MNTSPVQAYPVKALREHVVGLEAALSVCLADPGVKPVHRLRTSTRRVGAQLLLLALVPGLPEHREPAAALLRALRKIRRAGGVVRDLDAHRKLLEDLAGAEDAETEPAPAAPAAPAEAVSAARQDAEEAAAEDAAQPESHLLRPAAAALREHLKLKRAKAADELVAVLKHRQTKAAAAAEALLKVLGVAEGTALPPSDLLRDAEAVLKRHGLFARGNLARLSSDNLHTVRKAAKAARYLAETLPGDATLVAAANRFEAVQESGGQWHDAVELAKEARRFFSRNHPLSLFYRDDRRRKLTIYHDALRTHLPSPKSAGKRQRPPKDVRTEV